MSNSEDREQSLEPLQQERSGRETGRDRGQLAAAAMAVAVLSVVVPWAMVAAIDLWHAMAWVPDTVLRLPLMFPPVGLILGVTALVVIKLDRRQARPRAGRRALAAIVLSLGGAFWTLRWVADALHDVGHSRGKVCVEHVHGLCAAMLDYAAEHGGRFPDAADWCDRLKPYISDLNDFRCPEARRLQCAYAYNSALAGLRPGAIVNGDSVILIFESDRGWNAAGGPALLRKVPRHNDAWGDVFGYADGHAKMEPRHRYPTPLGGPQPPLPQWRPTLKRVGKGP